MEHKLQAPIDPPDGWRGLRFLEPEVAIDLAADNALLRAALAVSEGAGERRELITQELKHRIGNLLAVVHAIARQTFNDADAASVEKFSARLTALGAAQKLLIDSEARAALMASVVIAALAPHVADGERFAITGPDLALDGRRAHALTLALHELATNATKHGALSTAGGWIEVAWTCVGNQLEFVWREHGGPAVAEPVRRGFGWTLITRNLGLAFGGKVDLEFGEAGLACRLHAPLQKS